MHPIAGFAVFLGVTAVLGLSIFLSLPVVYSRRAQGRWATGLNAAAIGILMFLLADIFANEAPLLYPSGYLANAGNAAAFATAFALAFVGLALVERIPRRGAVGAAGEELPPSAWQGGPRRTALIVALGIGLQNLTEGLVFGANWTAGTLGIVAVVFLGFFLQNVSEGFPIAAPLLGTTAHRDVSTLGALYLVGGIPTILGGAIGFYGSSPLFLVVVDALAIGAIAYVLLPMLRGAFRPLESREASIRRDQLVSFGILIGFLIGFGVNAI